MDKYKVPVYEDEQSQAAHQIFSEKFELIDEMLHVMIDDVVMREEALIKLEASFMYIVDGIQRDEKMRKLRKEAMK